MKQADHVVFLCDLLHYLHCKLVVVRSDIRGGEDGCQLVLRRRYLVVLRFRQDAKLPKFFVEVSHKRLDSWLDDAEVMIVKLLSLWRLSAEERSSCVYEVLTLIKVLLVNQEVFLFRSNCRSDPRNFLVSEKLQCSQSLFVENFHRLEKRVFLSSASPP